MGCLPLQTSILQVKQQLSATLFAIHIVIDEGTVI